MRWKVGDPGKMTFAGCEADSEVWRDEGQGMEMEVSEETRKRGAIETKVQYDTNSDKAVNNIN